jgi:Flp pilus assembly protein TadD
MDTPPAPQPAPRPDPRPGGAPSPSGSPADALAWFRRAETLLSQHRPLDALSALGPVLDADPDLPSVQLLAGRAYLNSAQLTRAEDAFRRVLDLDPADHYARFALGKTLQRLSRLEEAQAQLRMAAAMVPRPEYLEALGEVKARIALSGD